MNKNQMNNIGIQQELENSLNQIYKMKFAFDDLENQGREDEFIGRDRCKIEVDDILQFKCLS